MRYLFFILLLFVFTHCEKFAMDRKYNLKLKNNSDHSIAYLAGQNFIYKTYVPIGPNIYPDTGLTIDAIPFDLIIEPGEVGEIIPSSSVKISDYFKDLPADTLSIYIFHLDTLKNNTIEDIQSGYKILKRYDLSLEDLEHLDYKLSYPPDAKMSGVKMYPLYP